MTTPRYPSLYQINIRVRLTELSRRLGRAVTLDDIPDAELDHLAEMGFDWVWLLSVWQNRPGRAAGLSEPPRVAQGVRGDALRPARGGHRGFRVRDDRLYSASAPGR